MFCFLLYGLCSIVRVLSYTHRPHRHTRQYQVHRSFNGMCKAFPSPDGFRESRCADTNLLRPAGKFTKQLPAATVTVSTINSQYYKISVLYFPQIFRTTVAGKYNLCCGLHIFCGLAVFLGLKPRNTYITIRLNVSEAS